MPCASLAIGRFSLGPEIGNDLQQLVEKVEERPRLVIRPSQVLEEEVPGCLVFHEEPGQRLLPQEVKQVPGRQEAHTPRQGLVLEVTPSGSETLDGAYEAM